MESKEEAKRKLREKLWSRKSCEATFAVRDANCQDLENCISNAKLWREIFITESREIQRKNEIEDAKASEEKILTRINFKEKKRACQKDMQLLLKERGSLQEVKSLSKRREPASYEVTCKVQAGGLNLWSSEEERREDALAPGAEEGRDKLRKAAVRSKYPVSRRYPNGGTRLRKAQSLLHESIV